MNEKWASAKTDEFLLANACFIRDCGSGRASLGQPFQRRAAEAKLPKKGVFTLNDDEFT